MLKKESDDNLNPQAQTLARQENLPPPPKLLNSNDLRGMEKIKKCFKVLKFVCITTNLYNFFNKKKKLYK